MVLNIIYTCYRLKSPSTVGVADHHKLNMAPSGKQTTNYTGILAPLLCTRSARYHALHAIDSGAHSSTWYSNGGFVDYWSRSRRTTDETL